MIYVCNWKALLNIHGTETINANETAKLVINLLVPYSISSGLTIYLTKENANLNSINIPNNVYNL